MAIKFRTLGINNGLIAIEKRCGFCRRKHLTEFPLDDLHLRSRMTSLCDVCESQLEEARKSFPELRHITGR